MTRSPQGDTEPRGPAVRAGIGLRAPHVPEALAGRLDVDVLEIHAENDFAEGGAIAELLRDLARRYALSVHGVGLSLGSVDPLDRGHLRRLRRLAEDARAVALSEHLCWSSSGGMHVHDLLPLPLDTATLAFVGARIDAAQQALGRQLLIENIARYTNPPSTMPESVFLSSLAARTGCGLLVDLNNLHVNEVNHGVPAAAFLDDIDWSAVGEIHLAGGEPDGDWHVDTHGADVPECVWALASRVAPWLDDGTLAIVERDSNLPAVQSLVAEARRARRLSQGRR